MSIRETIRKMIEESFTEEGKLALGQAQRADEIVRAMMIL